MDSSGEEFKVMMTNCPHCGSGSGYYVYLVATYSQWYDFDGNPTSASEPQTIRGGGIAYCEGCDRRLGTLDSKGVLACRRSR